jgi:HK97 family phage major capsid protein
MPVISALPLAYWVNGDTGQKQTTELNWADKYLNIEEIAVILPVPDNVIADVEMNIWDEAMPYMVEAVGRTLDSAVFFGTNAPASFPDDIYTSLDAAANDITEGTVASAGGYMADIDLALAALEADGYEADSFVAATTFKGKLRAARDADGNRIDGGQRFSGDMKMLDGMKGSYPMRGLWPTAGSSASPRVIFLQSDQFVVGVRQDISFKLFTEGVIQDNTGTIVYNLMQQDMSAMRLTFRVGWQVANVINYDQATEASRYPAASLDIP